MQNGQQEENPTQAKAEGEKPQKNQRVVHFEKKKERPGHVLAKELEKLKLRPPSTSRKYNPQYTSIILKSPVDDTGAIEVLRGLAKLFGNRWTAICHTPHEAVHQFRNFCRTVCPNVWLFIMNLNSQRRCDYFRYALFN